MHWLRIIPLTMKLEPFASPLIAVALILLSTSVPLLGAQQPDPLQTAARTLGVAGIRSIQFSGSGTNFTVGQAFTAGGAWPPVKVNSFTAAINYAARSMRVELVRTMLSPIPRGGGAAFQGEQRQIQVLNGNFAWNVAAAVGGVVPDPVALAAPIVLERKSFLWATPHGFVKAAQAGNATNHAVGANTEVSFQIDEKYRVTGIINPQGLVERIRYVIDNPVLGDMPVEIAFSGYRDFGGVQFPSRLLQTQGGHPSLELNITSVVANPTVEIISPESVLNPGPAPAIQVTSQQVAPGVYYLTGGSHHSVAIEMRDHVVVVEGPQSEVRGLAVVAKVKELIPNKPIRYVVNTHVHFDHSGGLRPFIDDGAAVVTHRSNRNYFDEAWTAPRTINPDKLSLSRRRRSEEHTSELQSQR